MEDRKRLFILEDISPALINAPSPIQMAVTSLQTKGGVHLIREMSAVSMIGARENYTYRVAWAAAAI
jgi:hypothetical protein